MDVPCRPTGLSSVSNDVARVLCPDGRILRTVDDESWTVAGSTPGAAAIRFPVPDVGFALAARGSCPATVLRSTNGGKKWDRLTCLKGDDPRGISVQDGSYAAIVDDTVHVSEDQGETWRRRTSGHLWKFLRGQAACFVYVSRSWRRRRVRKSLRARRVYFQSNGVAASL